MINRTYLEKSKEYNKFINSLNYNKIIFSFAEIIGRLKCNDNIWILKKSEKKYIVEELLSNINKYTKDEEYSFDKYRRCTAGTLSYSIDELGNLGFCQVLGSKNYILGDIFTIEERAKNNTFDILDEVKKNKLNNSINRMCRYYGV